jgi:catechol 2,3-dioxygenase-like lactoylglutathione lyase family enzyme
LPLVHIHLHARDLDASRRFYEALFSAAPVKAEPGYLKFLPEMAPINLALSAAPASSGSTVSHLGVQVESPATLRAHLARVKQAGLAVREELGVDCCYANQDKFWVRDPDGVEWEVYHLNHDLEDEPPKTEAAASACCSSALATLGRRR